MTTTLRLHLARIIGALFLLAGLAGCSAFKLGYNSLPELAYWWLDGYVDFNDDQTPAVRDELARLHGWHRSQELPRIVDILIRMEQMAPGPVTPAQACSFVPEIQARLQVLAAQAEAAMAATALGLDAKQLRHLERKHRGGNADWRKAWVEAPAAQRAERRFDMAIERAEMVYGKLDDPQRAVLRAWSERSLFDPQRILAERQRRQADLLQTLRRVQDSPGDTALARTLLREYLDRVQRSPDEGYRRYQDQVIDEACRTAAALHESTTAEQRDRAVRRLRAYQRDLRELSAQR